MRSSLIVLFCHLFSLTLSSQSFDVELISRRHTEFRFVREADMNNDGEPDLIAVDDTQILYYEYNVDAQIFNAPLLLLEDGSTQVYVYDMDKNGMLDVVTGNQGVILYNLGNGSFEIDRPLPSDHQDVIPVDLNADGFMDLVSMKRADTQIFMSANLGSKNFGPFQLLTNQSHVNTWARLFTSDINNDSIPDLIVSDFFESEMLAWLVDGQGGLISQQPIVIGNVGAAVMEYEDLDGNGYRDLICADSGIPSLSVIFLYPDDSMRIKNLIRPASINPYLAVHDYDKDGDQDIIVGGALGSQVYVNNGEGKFNTRNIESLGEKIRVFDSDYSDSGFYGFLGDENRLYRCKWNERDMNWNLDLRISAPNHIESHHLNKHGSLIISSKHYRSSGAFLNSEESKGSDPVGISPFYTPIDLATRSRSSLFTMDIDQDGLDDIVYTETFSTDLVYQYGVDEFEYNDLELRITLNNGAIPSGEIDIDRDGDMDLILSDGRVIENINGNLELGSIDFDLNTFDELRIQDINHDGFDDLVYGSRGLELHVVALVNSVNGFEMDTLLVPTSNYRTFAHWEAVDLDNDGMDEIVAHQNQQLLWIRNIGGEQSLDTLCTLEFYPNEMVVCDIDGDKNYDVLISNDKQLLLYDNVIGKPTSYSNIVAEFKTPLAFYSIIPEDIDRNGTDDFLIITERGRIYCIYSNRVVSTIDWESMNDSREITAVPNPNDGVFMIKGHVDHQVIGIKLFDLKGAIIECEFGIANSQILFNCQDLNPGLYQVLLLYSDGTSKSSSVIVR